MRLLAIHTATDVCSIALRTDDGVRAVDLDRPRAHAEQLVPMIQDLLGDRPASGIAVAAGPGSFTGLRIGLSTAKGLVFAWDATLYAASTLAAFARAAGSDDRTIVAMRARRGELFAGVYEAGGLHAVTDDGVIADTDFARWADEHAPGAAITGPDANALTSELHLDRRASDASATARSVLELVEESPQAHAVGDPSAFEPYYCKDFVARKPSRNIFDRLSF